RLRGWSHSAGGGEEEKNEEAPHARAAIARRHLPSSRNRFQMIRPPEHGAASRVDFLLLTFTTIFVFMAFLLSFGFELFPVTRQHLVPILDLELLPPAHHLSRLAVREIRRAETAADADGQVRAIAAEAPGAQARQRLDALRSVAHAPDRALRPVEQLLVARHVLGPEISADAHRELRHLVRHLDQPAEDRVEAAAPVAVDPEAVVGLLVPVERDLDCAGAEGDHLFREGSI